MTAENLMPKTSSAEIVPNDSLQRMKVQLMTEGLGISKQTLEELEAQSGAPLTLADYASTSGVTLKLSDDIWVNAPITKHNPNFINNPSNTLVSYDDRLHIVNSNEDYVAELIPVPEYHDKVLEDGSPITWIAVTHSDRVRLSPVKGCALQCDFCDIPFDREPGQPKYRGTKSVTNIVQASRIAINDPALPARHILISGGVPKLQDYGYENEVYQKVVEANPGIEVDVMMVPIRGLLKVRHLKEIGIKGLSINMELWNQEAAKKLMHNNIKASRAHYLAFIAEAVDVFGPGRVRSLMMVGLEAIEDTLKGVRALAERGCDPVLSPFRPDPLTPLSAMRPSTEGELLEVWQRSQDIVGEYGEVKLGPRCIPCMHNTLTFPDGTADYYHSTEVQSGQHSETVS